MNETNSNRKRNQVGCAVISKKRVCQVTGCKQTATHWRVQDITGWCKVLGKRDEVKTEINVTTAMCKTHAKISDFDSITSLSFKKIGEIL